VLFFDHSARSFAVVVFGLLAFSGLGSMWSARMPWRGGLAALVRRRQAQPVAAGLGVEQVRLRERRDGCPWRFAEPCLRHRHGFRTNGTNATSVMSSETTLPCCLVSRHNVW
jgi:hypothetical protein